MDSPWIVLGLGNPGEAYRRTRHNAGFRVAESLARELDARWSDEGASRVARVELAGRPLVLACPLTYMNRSGEAAVELCAAEGAATGRLLVVHDDIDLPLGRIRVRPGGGTGGHNGLRSLVDRLGGTEFPRVRLGIRGTGRAGRDLADYVLEPFDEAEESLVDEMIELGTSAVRSVVGEGVAAAMNRCNGPVAGPDDGD